MNPVLFVVSTSMYKTLSSVICHIKEKQLSQNFPRVRAELPLVALELLRHNHGQCCYSDANALCNFFALSNVQMILCTLLGRDTNHSAKSSTSWLNGIRGSAAFWAN